MRTLLLLFVLMTVGCAPMQFAKDGAGEQDLKNDHFDCRTQWDHSSGAIAFRQDPIANAYVVSEARQFIKDCMNRKGWSQVQ